MKVVVLGTGRVGRVMARDLALERDFQVTAVDISPDSLAPLEGAPTIDTRQADLSDADVVKEIVRGHDLAVGAVPGFMGYRTLQAILEAGRPVVEISFFPEDPFQLDGLARTQGLTAVVDAGVAPGCSNLILGRMEADMEKTTRFECVVGGLPVVRHWPFQYKAPFSPIDVIEEYTRPARLRRSGRTVVVPALSGLESLDFPGIGALEAFNTDGLRTLLNTCDTPNMVEKTVRYPGHAEWMRGLREAGFFRTKPMEFGDAAVSPRDVTARLLVDAWAFEEEEEDLTIMRVRVEGLADGRPERRTFHLFDRYDAETGTSSMARTTGYTATAMVRLLAAGLYEEPGISPPELVGRDRARFDFVLGELEKRNVRFRYEAEEMEL